MQWMGAWKSWALFWAPATDFLCADEQVFLDQCFFLREFPCILSLWGIKWNGRLDSLPHLLQ